MGSSRGRIVRAILIAVLIWIFSFILSLPLLIYYDTVMLYVAKVPIPHYLEPRGAHQFHWAPHNESRRGLNNMRVVYGHGGWGRSSSREMC